MYNCKLCRRTIGPHVPQHRVVVERKIKAKGWEIIREIGVCQNCKESLEKEEKVANHAQNPPNLRHATERI